LPAAPFTNTGIGSAIAKYLEIDDFGILREKREERRAKKEGRREKKEGRRNKRAS